MFDNRKEITLKMMREQDIDLMVLVPGSNLYYLTGNNFSTSERLLLYFLERSGKGTFLAPEVEKSKLTLNQDDIVFSYTDEEGPYSLLHSLRNNISLTKKIAVETNQMRLFEYEFLKELGIIGIHQTSNATNIIKEMRLQKNMEEVNMMKKAVHILEESLQATLPTIEIGKKEVEVAAKLEYEMRIRGSQGTPFSTIVASGYRGALPHGRASEKTIEDGDFIVIDFGATFNGYVGDMTRTIGIGNISNKQKEVYDIVKDAISTSIESIKIGKSIGDIDATAREIISKAGYGDCFTHRLGHGIGLDAHEEPYITQSNRDTIQRGMVFTVEPGIYIKNEFGVRLEDNIVVTEHEIVNLMTLNYDLIVL